MREAQRQRYNNFLFDDSEDILRFGYALYELDLYYQQLVAQETSGELEVHHTWVQVDVLRGWGTVVNGDKIT